ncbi:MAG: PIN domain-containing protein [Luteitalea sp.]|nr:PIN domain-containing protein [Luteitalea sp.]
MTRYLDASALAKRYSRERGSSAVRRLLATGRAATSRLSEVEVASALVRREREGALTIRQRDRGLARLRADAAALIVVELTPEVTATAKQLLLRHHLRASDAIQLASALYLHRELDVEVPFVAFDDRLVDAARGEGLTVERVRSPSRRRTASRERNDTSL